MKLIFTLFISLILSCSSDQKPSKEECLKSHLNNIKLLEKSDMEQMQKKEILSNLNNENFTKMIIETCINEKTKKQIECELNSKEFVDLKNCHKFIKE